MKATIQTLSTFPKSHCAKYLTLPASNVSNERSFNVLKPTADHTSPPYFVHLRLT